MSSSFSPYIDHVFNGNGKHCPTCQCGATQNFFLWKNQRESAVHRESRLIQSRVVPNYEPAAKEVGQNVIPNKTVWFKSVSPRPARIVIKISSPDRPNLRPSLVASSVHKRNNSQSGSSIKGVQISRVAQAEQIPCTPLKNLTAKNNIDQYSQSTYYSPLHSQRMYQIGRISAVRQI